MAARGWTFTAGCAAAISLLSACGNAPTAAMPHGGINVSWTANRETAVNRAGGGYVVYYSTTSGFDTSSAASVDVPYVSGAAAPTSTRITNLAGGTYYVKVVGYSLLNSPGSTTGSHSQPSAQTMIVVP